LLDRAGVDVDLGDGPDAGAAADADPGASAQGHLLLTEVMPAGNEHEFIEIYNPTSETIALDRYFLSDHTDYARLPGLFGDTGGPALAGSDFIVKFPDGAQIFPGDVVVVAIRFEAFRETFGFAPNYGLIDFESPDNRQMVVLDDTLMTDEPQISNSGEGVILFFWDGATDLVADVDMVIAGRAPTATNALTDKSGVQVDGPDADASPSAYRPDDFSLPDMDADVEPAVHSYQRRALEGDNERRDNRGNGLVGDDETSEDTRQTWTDSAQFAAPTPGVVPGALRQ
jgi:hypothetical protein